MCVWEIDKIDDLSVYLDANVWVARAKVMERSTGYDSRSFGVVTSKRSSILKSSRVFGLK